MRRQSVLVLAIVVVCSATTTSADMYVLGDADDGFYNGAERAKAVARETLEKAQQAVGLRR